MDKTRISCLGRVGAVSLFPGSVDVRIVMEAGMGEIQSFDPNPV